ncbi:MAG: ABC transporter permease [Candidatus Limnocylindrales bacterium]
MTAPSDRQAAGRALPVILVIVRREVSVRLRSRVFRVGTAGMTILVVIGVMVASRFVSPSTATTTSMPRVGFSGGAKALESTFTTYATEVGATVTITDIADPTAGAAQVTAGQLDMLVTGSATQPTALVDDAVPDLVEVALDGATQVARLNAAGLPSDAVTAIMASVPVVNAPAASSSSDADQTQNLLAALVVGILLYVSLGAYGGAVAQGVVEEESTRIVEILLSTVRPSQLLAGKVIGVGLVGILQLTIVGAAALIAGSVAGVASIPALSPATIGADLFWFTLGFLLYATVIAATASLVSRPEEVTSAITPVILPLLASYLLVFVALPDPTSPLIAVLSVLPPIAPILMSVRIALGAAEPWQVALSIVLTIASIVALTRFAGHVYANSVLRFGTRVPFQEALRRK